MNLMYAQMGLSAINSVSGFFVGREQYKMERAMQAYNNTMSALSAAQANNVTTLNEIQANDAATRQEQEIQRELMIAEGQAKVAAGAAGVTGGSVEGVMRGLRSSAARAKYATDVQLEQQLNAFNQERRNTAISKAMNKDISVIPKPSATSALLGVGKNMLAIWDSHQPEGERIGDQFITGRLKK